jgi:lipoate-protein ligase B
MKTNTANTSKKQAAEVAGRKTRSPQARPCLCIDFDMVDYRKAWKLQTSLAAARKESVIDRDIVLFLEHPAVFTLGRRGGADNLLVSQAFLEKSGIPVIQVERGGNITYHGPGQLVVYPIINLVAAGFTVVEYVWNLEEVMIRTAKTWGVPAQRNPLNRGVWVGRNKLGSIGITVRRGISFHGLAFNVNLDLTPFSWIQPCGLQGVHMTSMRQEISADISMENVREVLKQNFEAVFNIKLISGSTLEMPAMLAQMEAS